MKEQPILFSAPMVRALLAGTKTQTRRVVKPTPEWVGQSGVLSFEGRVGLPHAICPYGQPGDRLNVKDAAWMWCERRPNGKTKTGRDKWLYVPMREAPIHYAANHPQKPSISVVSPDTGNVWGWRLKIGRFLPSWASRITLEITAVRVERLQDISEADTVAEGIPAGEVSPPDAGRFAYSLLWDQINGPGSWDANPWVWVVEFKRVTE